MQDTQLNMKFQHKESKQAIREAAHKRRTSMTGLIWRGLVKEAPELKDVYLKER